LWHSSGAQYIELVGKPIRELDEMFMSLPLRKEIDPGPPKPEELTAMLLVTGYNGLGVRTLPTIVGRRDLR
jgi:hypothetical protein